jgi:hypothetical protein
MAWGGRHDRQDPRPLAAPGGLDDLRRWARTGWVPVVVGVLAFGCAMITPHLALMPLLTSPIFTRLFNRQKPLPTT